MAKWKSSIQTEPHKGTFVPEGRHDSGNNIFRHNSRDFRIPGVELQNLHRPKHEGPVVLGPDPIYLNGVVHIYRSDGLPRLHRTSFGKVARLCFKNKHNSFLPRSYGDKHTLAGSS